MTHVSHEEFAAFGGIDGADATHDGCLQAARAAKRTGLTLEHTPEAIEAWISTLRLRCNGHPVASGLALHKGPLVSALRTDALLVLFPLKPLTLARSRDAFTPRRAQDDPTDAELQLELLLTPRDTLQPLQPQRPTMRALDPLVAPRRCVVGDTVRITHRLTSTLKNSVPQGRHWFQDKATRMFCDFLGRWPTRNAAQLARRSILARFFRDHHVRSADVIAQRLHAINTAPPLTTDAGGIAPKAFRVQALVNQRRVTLEAIETFDNAIAQRAQTPPDCPLFQALPGAGPVFAPRLLGAFGAQRERYASAAARQK
jgi:hypothetical protein